MIRTQIYLPEDLYHELKLLAANSNKKFSELIREGAKLVTQKELRKKKKKFGQGFIGAGKGGPKDLSSNLDYYLYVEPYKEQKKK